ncbi:MAG TPA: biotin/lipoyl-binding protein [Gemmataceae bacterium]|nr:biotin/lipoyl-binding protein [Gemmataceae bacterium]
MLLGLVCISAYNIWNSFFRYLAYGTITGRTIEMGAPWDGSVGYLHIREGEMVRQGQLLATLDKIELRHRKSQVDDDIRVAQASVESESARLKWQSAFELDQSSGTLARYYDRWGTLLRDQAQLDELRIQFQRNELLYKTRAVSLDELQQSQFAMRGLEDKVSKSKIEVRDLEKRAGLVGELLKREKGIGPGLAESGKDQLKPSLARIEALQAERVRLQEELDQGQIRAAANGLIIKIHHFPGEKCKFEESIITLLEEGSLQVMLYIPQNASKRWAVGQDVELLMEPYSESLNCRVTQLGDRYEAAPEHLKRHYKEGEKLLPVFLQAPEERPGGTKMRLNSVVKLSYRMADFIPTTNP